MPKVLSGASSGGGRSGRGRRTATSLAEINVVPLVDVMLVLLIVFMVAAPMIQRGIDVNLPVARRVNQIEGERVTVSVPIGYRENKIVYLNEEPVRADLLPERVRQKLEMLTQKSVYLRGDRGLSYGDLMEVVDRLKAAGVLTVGLETTMPNSR
jgi:biopolymer transport protein TolR